MVGLSLKIKCLFARKKFTFKNFGKPKFVNELEISEEEGHHPDIHLVGDMQKSNNYAIKVYLRMILFRP